MITDVPGFRVGHHTDRTALTGCTVILCPEQTRASCEVRGASPGSRELALLHPDKRMDEIHAILLTGGSAFGLAAADGVMRWLEEHKVGYPTPWGRVPIVPSAVVFDLNAGSPAVRPDATAGYTACESAVSLMQEGSVGAGTGTSVGKWMGTEHWMKGGVGSVSRKVDAVTVGVLAVVNAVGDVTGADGAIVAGARDKDGTFFGVMDPTRKFHRHAVAAQTNTTLVVMATNAAFSKIDLHRIAQRMHDGMARAVIPVHTSFDGDVTFALSAGGGAADLDVIAETAADLTSAAIRRAVQVAHGVPGIPSVADF